MDLVLFLGACAIGILTGLIPGLHVNTLAAITLATLPLESGIALALVAVGTVHTVVSILPTTYLGAPSEDTAMATLPAHRMLQEGRAPEAIQVSVVASTLVMIVVVCLLLPVKWILAAPLHGAKWLARWAAPLLIGVVLYLWLQERHRGRIGLAHAGFVILMAGALGFLAWTWPTANPWGIPASPLLPLLTGLFALPGLRHASDQRVLIQDPPPQYVPPMGRSVLVAAAISAATAILPGVTGAVATAIAAGKHQSPRQVIATLSAVNTAHHGFALAMLWIVGASRSGLAEGIRGALRVHTWNGALPIDLHAVMATALAATLVAAIGTLALEPVLRHTLMRLPAKRLHRSALALLILVVAALTGPWGLALLVVAAAIGELPLVFGIRRVHLAACLLIPVIIHRLA